jgi:hypothetical protein
MSHGGQPDGAKRHARHDVGVVAAGTTRRPSYRAKAAKMSYLPQRGKWTTPERCTRIPEGGPHLRDELT